jgi:hypothetical protein
MIPLERFPFMHAWLVADFQEMSRGKAEEKKEA